MLAYPKSMEPSFHPVTRRSIEKTYALFAGHQLELLKEQAETMECRYLAEKIASTAVAKAIQVDLERQLQAAKELPSEVGRGLRR